MRAVMTPVATPRAKEPLKTPRKIPKDFNRAMASKLWLLSPAGWYATMELEGRGKKKKKKNRWEPAERGSQYSRRGTPNKQTQRPKSSNGRQQQQQQLSLSAVAPVGRIFFTGYWSWGFLLGLACKGCETQTCTFTERLHLSN